MRATWTRIWADEAGNSHFAEDAAPMTFEGFAPPAPPLALSAAVPVTEVRYLGAPAGWDSEPHPAPRRQLVVMLRGLVRAETSDGESRTFGPGAVVLVEDTWGRGHRTSIPGDEDWLALVVVLA